MSAPPTNGDLIDLLTWRSHLIDEEGGKLFMQLPDRWMDDPHYRCVNGHVSRRVLKSEGLCRDACLACSGEVLLTFPEDTEEP